MRITPTKYARVRAVAAQCILNGMAIDRSADIEERGSCPETIPTREALSWVRLPRDATCFERAAPALGACFQSVTRGSEAARPDRI
jgi:hypothetical protein